MDFQTKTKDRWLPEDTYILLILGSNPNFVSQRGKEPQNSEKMLSLDPSTITKKYINYYMASHGVLIKRLAEFYQIPPENVKILANGTKEDFSVDALTNEKLYLQLDKTSIYETKISSNELDFIYFGDNSVDKKIHIDEAIEQALESIPLNSRILCFLDGFDNIPLLKIYIPIRSKNSRSLRLFNDSCYSGSLIDLVEKYYQYSNVVIKAPNRYDVTLSQLTILAGLSNKIGSVKKIKARGDTLLTDNQYYQITNLNEVIEQIKILISMGIDDLEENFSASHFTIIIRYLKKLGRKTISNFFGNFQSITIFLENQVRKNAELPVIIQVFQKFGFLTLNDVYFFNEIIELYLETNGGIYSCGSLLKLYNKENINLLASISKDCNLANSKELYKFLNLFELQNIPQFNQYLFQCPNDHSIITSAFSNGKSVTFGTRRIKGTNIKAIFGSPAFGAFIDEVFFNITDSPIDIRKIQEEAVGDDIEEKGALEYAAVCPNRQNQKMTKEWIRLDIKQKKFGDLSNERFFSDEFIKEHLTKEEILDKIGFKLVQKFEEDGETPIDKDNDLFVELAKDGTPRKRIHRSSKTIDVNQEEIIGEIEYDEYYSDDEILIDDANTLKSPISSGPPTAAPSDSESEFEDDPQYVTLKRSEAKEIIKKLNLPAVSWGVDAHRFIVMALVRKSKELVSYKPFDLGKERGFYNGFYTWASSAMGKYINVCQIHDAHKLLLRISDWANENILVFNYDFDDLEHLLASICRLANEYITEMYRPDSVGEVIKRMKAKAQ